MLCIKESIKLNKIEVKNNLVKYYFNVSDGLKDYFTNNYLFIEYSDDICLEKIPNSILVIPFISSILPLIWVTDSVMWVNEVDKTFYRSLSRIKNAYQDIYDYFPLKGSLIPAQIIDNDFQVNRETLVLFSGGLDAHTTYLRNQTLNPLLFNVQGWYKENTDEKNNVADIDIKDITRFSSNEKCDFRYAKSNFATILNSRKFDSKFKKKTGDSLWHGFQHSMAFISIAIPVCYYYGVRTIYIASSFTIGDYGRCASYPTTDSEFEFADLGRVIHDGFELSRQDKVKIVVEHQKKMNSDYQIKVCTFNEENCTMCEKCVRTMLGIIAENGDITKFGFNVEGNLLNHFKSLFENNIVFFDVQGESKKHWGYIKNRMIENYDNISEKELVDWFLNVDLVKIRKKEVFKYRIRNFPKLLLKKIGVLKK